MFEPFFCRLCSMLRVVIVLKNYVFAVQMIPSESIYQLVTQDGLVKLCIQTIINFTKESRPLVSHASPYLDASTSMFHRETYMGSLQRTLWLFPAILSPVGPKNLEL